jgi:hypothetical protein
MASTFNLSNFSANSIANSALNIAAVFGGATLTIYGPSQPANANTALSGQLALAIFTLPAAGSNTVTNPSNNALITFGAISNVTASNTGTATFFRITNGANTVCDGSVGTSGADCNINSVSISSGATVAITAFTYTVTE